MEIISEIRCLFQEVLLITGCRFAACVKVVTHSVLNHAGLMFFPHSCVTELVSKPTCVVNSMETVLLLSTLL